MPRRKPQRTRCSGDDQSSSRAVSLPVVQNKQPAIRPSRASWKRAAVLGTIQLAMIAHFIQWQITGSTLTPVEPSESVETLRDGVINAGFILFALLLISTAILGRWFCGWGCHVVMLQDLCGWMMKKMGVRPKPFRSRLLVLIPTGLALYMFVWPVVERWLRDFAGPASALPPWKATLHLTTTDFWATFPGVAIAVPFLLICGFGCVYFLGAKGYCSYGCPYGGFFAPLDRFARGRIRVTDDCEQCGHCTAVCTSNVRVHEEVREYGMVVDPGCMKCMDCVSVCPKDALYFGFGASARNRPEPKNAAPQGNFDLTWSEEVVLVGVYFVTLIVLYGLYAIVPFLMASGMAAIVTFLAWKLSRMLRTPSVNLHRYRLRFKGRWTLGGVVFAGITTVVLVFVIHSAAVRLVMIAADSAGNRAGLRMDDLLNDDAAPIAAAARADLDQAITLYGSLDSLANGGFALMAQPDLDVTLAWLYLRRGDLEEAAGRFASHLEHHEATELVTLYYGRVLIARDRVEAAMPFLLEQSRAHPEWIGVADEAVTLLRAAGRDAEATALRGAVYEANPESAYAVRRYATALLDAGEQEEGRRLLRRSLVLDSSDPTANFIMARQLLGDQRLDDALRYAQQALAGAPDHPQINALVAQILRGLGRGDEAEPYDERSRP